MKRTTHRSSKGTKLYAVRDAKGQFEDIQTYKRAHGEDAKRRRRRTSEEEIRETSKRFAKVMKRLAKR